MSSMFKPRSERKRLLRAGLDILLPFLAACASCGAQAYHPMFDGKTLKGWHTQGGGAWRVTTDGLVEGTHTLDGDFGHLVSDSSFTDFRLHFQWKLTAGGNSGLYFHAQEGGEGGMAGAQVEMDESYSGGIYSTGTTPWGWIFQPKAEDAKKWYKPQDWNDVVVIVKGTHATVTENGFAATNTSSADLGKDGHFAFQVHRGIVMTLLIRSVEWSEVPGSTSAREARSAKPAGLGHSDPSHFQRPGSSKEVLVDGARFQGLRP